MSEKEAIIVSGGYAEDSGSSKGEGRYSYNDEDKLPQEGQVSTLPKDTLELSIDEEGMEIIQAHLHEKALDEWLELLKHYLEQHHKDPLIAEDQFDFMLALLEGPSGTQSQEDWEYYVRFYGFLFHEWSIYPEVRVVTRPIEEQEDEDYHNFRVYLIGCCWGWAGAVLSTFFLVRFPTISVSSMALQICIAGSGKLFALLPRMTIPYWKGKRFVVNNGKPWSFKEQVLASITMSVADLSPYAAYAIFAQGNNHFYGFPGANSFGYLICFTMSSNVMGFGLAGLFRSYLVYPARMVWFSVLPSIKLSRTLTAPEPRTKTNGWILKGPEFFWLFTIWWFGWYWVVNTGAQFLQYFEWMCWIKPENVNLNAITGSSSGLGLNPVGTFDPNIFNQFMGIYTPVNAYVNWMVGYFASFIGIVIMWYTNVRFTGYLPINTNTLYDNTGAEFNVSMVMNPETRELDMENYQQYSMPFWCAGNVLAYGANFMIYTAMVVYAILYYHVNIIESTRAFVKGFKREGTALSRFTDTFSRRQRKYKEVPEWWYTIVLAGSIGMAIGCVEGYKFTNTPVWSIFLAVGLGIVFIPLSGILQATTTYYFETNVLMELIVGYALPGNPNANMVSKVFATNFMAQADNWINNQKEIHYCNISPRSLFMCQLTSVIGSSFVQVGIMTWQLNGGIPHLCDQKQPDLFTCADIRTYFNASVLWGTIGPARVFKGLYPTMKYAFLIGAVYPLPFWAARRLLPLLASKSKMSRDSKLYWWVSGQWLKYINEIVMVSAPCNAWAPANMVYYIGDFYICLLFNLYIRKKFPEWWRKYAYLFYAAFSNGYAWGGFIDFFATQYTHIVTANWWGNSVDNTTSDGLATAIRLPLPSSGYFGPRKGEFPR